MLEDESHKPYNQLTIEEKKELDQQNLELKLAYEQQKKEKYADFVEDYNSHLIDHKNFGYILPLSPEQWSKIPAKERGDIEVERNIRNNWKTYCIGMKNRGMDTKIYYQCAMSEDEYTRKEMHINSIRNALIYNYPQLFLH